MDVSRNILLKYFIPLDIWYVYVFELLLYIEIGIGISI